MGDLGAVASTAALWLKGVIFDRVWTERGGNRQQIQFNYFAHFFLTLSPDLVIFPFCHVHAFYSPVNIFLTLYLVSLLKAILTFTNPASEVPFVPKLRIRFFGG